MCLVLLLLVMLILVDVTMVGVAFLMGNGRAVDLVERGDDGREVLHGRSIKRKKKESKKIY